MGYKSTLDNQKSNWEHLGTLTYRNGMDRQFHTETTINLSYPDMVGETYFTTTRTI